MNACGTPGIITTSFSHHLPRECAHSCCYCNGRFCQLEFLRTWYNQLEMGSSSLTAVTTAGLIRCIKVLQMISTRFAACWLA